MFKFEWDDQKAAGNLSKHGVSFDEAVSVFGDGQVLPFSDPITVNSKIEVEPTEFPTSHGFWWSSTQNGETAYESSAPERQHGMKKASTKMVDQDIPELKRDELGKGVRGKYLKQFMQGSNVVVLRPEIQKAFPTSEAVNKALASMLAFAQETQGLTGRAGQKTRKRVAA